MAHEGFIEQLTLPSDESGRNKKYHVALVSVPGKDMYEVGLRALFFKLGVEVLDSTMVEALMACRPEIIWFDGSDITYPIKIHKIELTPESAEEWVSRYKKL